MCAVTAAKSGVLDRSTQVRKGRERSSFRLASGALTWAWNWSKVMTGPKKKNGR